MMCSVFADISFSKGGGLRFDESFDTFFVARIFVEGRDDSNLDIVPDIIGVSNPSNRLMAMCSSKRIGLFKHLINMRLRLLSESSRVSDTVCSWSM